MNQNSYVIGIIGGAGTGKTYMSKYLVEHLNAMFIEGDQIAHELLRDKGMIHSISEKFGDDIVENGEINRSKLGKIVFADKQSLMALNEIMHGTMFKMIEEKIRRSDHKYIILEAAVMIEAGFSKLVHGMVCLKAHKDIRLERLISSRSIDLKTAENILKSQRNDYEDYADYIFDTTEGIESIKDDLEKMMNEIREAEYEKNN
ncbi:Dephospho-CoA kinase [Petrocella atlantisensis]|uniref:Dephospho-CoA kinase n=1 Tax=Petrocella atlantisensis TaxID=2173034 RepID=A0A3P7PS43_9FIRM|nr:dephospho-CoA kinase [Petrocella atlantisensis]VDN46031.1 Dephospho-CoA kinase [Petrocella atlantisensis]